MALHTANRFVDCGKAWDPGSSCKHITTDGDWFWLVMFGCSPELCHAGNKEGAAVSTELQSNPQQTAGASAQSQRGNGAGAIRNLSEGHGPCANTRTLARCIQEECSCSSGWTSPQRCLWQQTRLLAPVSCGQWVLKSPAQQTPTQLVNDDGCMREVQMQAIPHTLSIHASNKGVSRN